MSIDLNAVSDATTLMAHTVILSGIIANMPEEKRGAVREFALSCIDERIELEKAKEKPNLDIISILSDAREKAINLLR